LSWDRTSALHEIGAGLFLEIGARPALIGLARECLPENKACWLPSLCPERDAGQQMLETLSALYVRGLEVPWPALYGSQSSRRLSLPLYPFQRERFWWDQIPDSDGPAAPQPTATVHPLLGERLRAALPVFQCCFDRPELAWLNDHRVHDRAVVPASAWLEMALAAIVAEPRPSPVGLRDIVFEQILLLRGRPSRTVQLTLLPASGGETTFEIHSLAEDADATVPWTRHARGWTAAGDRLPIASSPLSELRFRLRESVSPTTLGERLQERGLHSGPAFQCVERLWRRDREALGKLQVPATLAQQATAYRVFPGLLDAAIQMVAVALPAHLLPSAGASTYVPTGLTALRFHRSPERHCWAHVLLRQTELDKVQADIRLLTETGQPLLEIAGLRLEPLPFPAPVPSARAVPPPRPATAVVSRAALLAVEAPGRHALLRSYLRQQFASALRITETRLDDSVPVGSLGLDSLMLVNLGTKLERDLGVRINITDFLAGPSVSTLTETLLEELTREGQ
jgi:myxalamid-type polyketide synthase MxaB